MYGLKLANVSLNRRSLAQLAQTEPDSFEAAVRVAQQKLKDKWGNMYTATQTLAL
jgi:ribosomal protein L20